MRNVKRSVHWSQLVVRGFFIVALAALLLAGLQSIRNPNFSNTTSAPNTPAATTQSVAVATAPTPAMSDGSPPSSLPTLEIEPVASTNHVGDEACRSCHQDKTSTYHRTAHYLTSRLPTRNSIAGKFSPNSDILKTLNTNLCFKMEATEEGFFQTAMLRLSPTQVLQRTERFDVVIGSGRRGQTYLYWRDDDLFELPVSYWVELAEWGNSPGYTDGAASFSRPIAPRCLECHANSFESLAPPINRFNRIRLVLGITCEKCHGPGREHIERFRSRPPPQSPAEAAIINPARLSRDRQVDVCGLCHAGAGEPLVPSLSFVPGDVLDQYLNVRKSTPDARVDVHGNQVELLRKSRCFQSSPAMTCTTCHDVHTPQRDLAAFASRCLTCHQVESCGAFSKLSHKIDGKCVVCHMPLQQTDIVIARVNGTISHLKLRNHQIAIYPDVQLP